MVLFLFKQFLIRTWKKDLGGEVGAELGKGDACRTWHGESKAPFLRLFQQVIGLCWGARYGPRAAARRGLSCRGEASVLTLKQIESVFTGPSRQEKKIR